MQSNTNGALLAGTTAVGMYPHGTWYRGPLDMTGNVLECCLNSYEEPTNTSVRAEGSRVLRGGSWNNNQDNARCAYRNNNHPHNSNDNTCNRVVCASHIDPRPLAHWIANATEARRLTRCRQCPSTTVCGPR